MCPVPSCSGVGFRRVLKPLDLYFIPTRSNRYVLFSSPEAVQVLESESGDRVQQFIEWFVRHPNRFVAWIGGILHAGHGYYLRLEDRIDPGERILKSMASVDRFVIHFIRIRPGSQIARDYESFLKRQRAKHIFWFSIDLVLSAVVLVFTPVLAPIPGPNVFFYYPFLRLLSHYRAIRGAASGLHSRVLEFKSLPELSGLEDNLPGLATFLERME